MKVNFEYNFEELDNNELRINGRRTDSYGVAMWDSIIIKKEWISWIITTLRNLTYEDYNTWQRRIINDYEDCRLIIRIFLRENDYSFIKINPFWKDKNRIISKIEIPYLSWNKRLLMSEFIEPFLVALSQFLTEEERGKLPPPWSEREEEEKKKGKRKRKKDDQSDDGALAHTDAVINNDDTAVRKSNGNIVRLCIVSIFNKLKYRRFFIGKVLDTQKFSYCAIFHNIFKSFHKKSLIFISPLY